MCFSSFVFCFLIVSLVRPYILLFFKKVVYLLATVAPAFQISLLTVICMRSFYLTSATHQLL